MPYHRLSTAKSETALRGQGILVRDRSYEAPGCVRITVGTPKEIRALLNELAAIPV